jgi:hypothetical protein
MKKQRLIVGLTLLSFGIVSAAYAATQLRIEAQGCSGANLVNRWGAFNGVATGDPITLACPVITDANKGVSGLDVLVWDRTNAASVSCQLYTKDSNGNLTASGSPQATSVNGQSANSQTLHWTPTASVGLVVECTVPKRDTASTTGEYSGISAILMNYN